ncbi:unnamed protein product [Absidia cylindrospora]
MDNTQNSEMKSELEQLGVGLVDQSTLEQRIMAEADKAMMDLDNAKEQKRLDKSRKQASDAQASLLQLKSKLKDRDVSTLQRSRLEKKINEQITILRNANRDESDILERLKGREQANTTDKDLDPSKRQADETQKEYLIRTGKITPFASVSETAPTEDGLVDNHSSDIILPGTGGNYMTHQHLKKPRTMDTFGMDQDFNTNWRRLKKAQQEKGDDDQDYDDSGRRSGRR